MTTVRLTFRMAADSSRKGTLYFQIIHRNTVKTLSTRCRIFADEWDEPNSRIFIMSPVSARRTATLLGIRNRIRHEMHRLNGIINKYDCSGLPYNTADIIHCYRNSQPAVNHSLFAFMHRHIRMLSAQGRLRTADTYRQTLSSITTFRNGADISLSMLRVNRNLKKIGVMAGIPIPLTMYVARHSWATAAKEKDISIGIISQAMGHDSENTTQIYLASIKTGKIDDANRDILNGI